MLFEESEEGGQRKRLRLIPEEQDEVARLIKRRVIKLKASKWGKAAQLNRVLCDGGADAFVYMYSTCVFTNLVQRTVDKGFMKGRSCSDCRKAPATDRAHRRGFTRPELVRMAIDGLDLKNGSVTMWDIMEKFLMLHNRETIAFKCRKCHQTEE